MKYYYLIPLSGILITLIAIFNQPIYWFLNLIGNHLYEGRESIWNVCKGIGTIYLYTLLPLVLLKQNMHKWNKGSNADKLLNEAYEFVKMGRHIFILMLIMIAVMLGSFTEIPYISPFSVITNQQMFFNENFGLEQELSVVVAVLTFFLLLVEVFWSLFKLYCARRAMAVAGNGIGHFFRISKRNGQYVIKSTYHTMFNDKGNYYSGCDIDLENGKWTQTTFEHVGR